MKQHIDEHIVKFEKYYRGVCYTYYNGRYLYEDLLQELYIEFINTSPNIIRKFHVNNKLIYLGHILIRKIYSHRGYHKRYDKGKTSPLFESCHIECLDIDKIDLTSSENIESELDELINNLPPDPEYIFKQLDEHEKEDYFEANIVRLSQNESLHSISKRTRISYPYIVKKYKEANENIKKRLIK